MKGARALTPLEIQAVLSAFDGKYAIRNRTLFLLCANLGARITEALNLNVGDVFSDGEVVDVLYFRRETVKGKNEGVALTLPSGAKSALSVFLSWKEEAGEPLSKKAPLFLSRQGSRLTRQQAHNIFKKAYKKVGLRGHVTTHSPRKTYAQMVYENSGNDLVVTQRALRHTSISATLYYLDTLSDDVTKAMPNFEFFSDIDKSQKTSNSKVIKMPNPKELKGRKKLRK
ncbi:MAG: tyrosine-type recombinase/integrase [Candidatus Poribacteria bacterium]